MFAHLTETVSPFFSTTCPASEDKNEEKEEERKEEWEDKGEEESWNPHPDLRHLSWAFHVIWFTVILSARYGERVWEAKGSFEATASGRRSVALKLSLLNTEALIHIVPSTLVPTHLCQ